MKKTKPVYLLYWLSLSLPLLLVAISCRDKHRPNYTTTQVKTSFDGSLKITQNTEEGWKVVSTDQLTYEEFHELSSESNEDIYQKVLMYEPISLTLAEYKNKQGVSFRLSLFQMSSPLDAWGAYSRLRNPSIPAYVHSSLQKPSEGFYWEGQIILYRGTHLAFIDHNITELASIKNMVTKLIKNVPNKPYDRSLVQTLPRGQLIKTSVRYYKKQWPVIDNFRRCVVGLYQPHSSMRIFICQFDNAKKSRVAFKEYHKRLQREEGLGTPKIEQKSFSIQGSAPKADYFFYNSGDYELHSVFIYKKFIFGIMGGTSKNLCLALSNEILGNISPLL